MTHFVKKNNEEKQEVQQVHQKDFQGPKEDIKRIKVKLDTKLM